MGRGLEVTGEFLPLYRLPNNLVFVQGDGGVVQ